MSVETLKKLADKPSQPISYQVVPDPIINNADVTNKKQRPFIVDKEEYPFKSHWYERNGASMHYVDEGEGIPIVLTHGNPVSLPAITYSNSSFTFDKLEMAASGQSKMEKYSINGRFKANSVDSLISATQAGLGYSIADLSVLKSNLKGLGLVPILQNYRFPSDFGALYAVYPHRNQTPLVKKFIETVQDVIGTPPVWEDYVENYSSMYI